MTGYTRKISRGTLLLSLALSLASTQAHCGERPRLELIARDSYLPGVPVLLRVELRDADGSLHRQRWDAVARIRIEGEGASISPGEVMLRNGIGSVLARIEGTGELRLVISLDGEEITKELADLTGEPRREVAGDLPAEETEWSGVIQVTGNLTIPEDGTLRLLPGALVLLNGVECVLDGLGRFRVSELGDHGVYEDLLGELSKILGHCCRKQQVLTFFREFGYDSPDVRQEAHVEHVVGFVEDEGLDLAEAEYTLAL